MACCIENNQKFLIRTKDINVYSSILSNLNLLDEEFDLDVTKILTCKQMKLNATNRNTHIFHIHQILIILMKKDFTK